MTELQAKACEEFYYEANKTEKGPKFFPISITPFAITNIDATSKDTLLRAIKSVSTDSMLILMLGEANDVVHGGEDPNILNKLFDAHHKIFDTDIVRSFPGPKTILVIDPSHKLEGSKSTEDFPLDSRLVENNVVSVKLVKAAFPLTPVYGPHREIYTGLTGIEHTNKKAELMEPFLEKNVFKKAYGELRGFKPLFELALRRAIYENALDVLNALVSYPNPLVISSRIQNICYRSFKYLIDMRSQKDRITVAFYGKTGTVPKQCTSAEEFPLFPRPFEKCKSWWNSDEKRNKHIFNYYYPDYVLEKAKTHKSKNLVLPLVREVDKWANDELNEKRQKKAAGGKRKTRKQKRRSRKH